MKPSKSALLAAVFIALIGTSPHTLQARDGGRRTLDKTFPLAKDGMVSIETFKGSIEVTTWDKAEVGVHVEIEADGTGPEEREKVEGTEIRFDDSPTALRIKSDYDKIQSGFSWSNIFGDNSGSLPFVRYTISMPASARLKIKDYKSDTRVTALHADLDLTTYKGTVVVKDFSGGVDLETYKGEVEFAFSKLASSSRFESQKGRIRISIPSNGSFDLNTDFGRRVDFDSEFHAEHEGRHSNKRYTGSFNGGGPDLRLISEKGDFALVKSVGNP